MGCDYSAWLFKVCSQRHGCRSGHHAGDGGNRRGGNRGDPRAAPLCVHIPWHAYGRDRHGCGFPLLLLWRGADTLAGCLGSWLANDAWVRSSIAAAATGRVVR